VTIDLSRSVTRWPLRHKLRRGLWTYFVEPLVRWLPKALSPVRIAALRSMGAHIGPRCLILPGVKVLMPWNLHLHGHVAVGEHVNIYNFAPIEIGRMTVISQYTYLCTGSHDYRRNDMPLIYAPITIGQEVWVAAGVFIAPGVRLADGVVVGAMSVVTKPLLEAWSVYGGNPCRRIKRRELDSGV
jgi:putative colanic acid biosynthesis acetyltransferase WcaF